jgi:hypothetical protein
MEVTSRIYFATTTQPQLALQLRLMLISLNHQPRKYIIGGRAGFHQVNYLGLYPKNKPTK